MIYHQYPSYPSGTTMIGKGLSRSAGAFLLFFSTLYTSSLGHTSAASTVGPPFARIIDGRIVCDEVIELHSLARIADLSTAAGGAVEEFQHSDLLQCSVNRAYSQSGTVDGIKLNLVNVDQAFNEEWKRRAAQGKTTTRLVVTNGIVDGSLLILPDNNLESQTIITESVSSHGEIYQSAAPLLIWQEAELSQDISTENGGGSRRLAINQTGNKSVLIFRISTDDGNGNINSPAESASEVSEAVFGQASVDGAFNTLSSHYSACSYGQLTFSAASPTGTSAAGVVDVTVPSGLTSQIQNSVITLAQTTLNLDMNDYDHVILHFPRHTRSDLAVANPTTNWLAYGNLPGKLSSFHGNWVLNVQTLMHEVGHNIGLRHSNEGAVAYADTTCIMGR